MVHCFEIGGRKLVYDPASGGLHAVDDLAFEVLSSLARGGEVPGCDPPGEVAEVLAEIKELELKGSLFLADYGRQLYSPPAFAPKALCLMVAQECNLRCAYCFAGQGAYGGGGLMAENTAFKAVDYLMEASGAVRDVEVDFFGGEPLLNFPVVAAVVEYGMQAAQTRGKNISFTITTNALLLDKRASDFLLAKGVNVVLSIDGRKHVHDRFRRLPSGRGSYDLAFVNAKRHFTSWAGNPRSSYCYIRGTYTRLNLDFAEDFSHLVDEGLTAVSLEPVVAAPEEPYAVREADLAAAATEYERLAQRYLDYRRRERPVRFFHFELDPAGGPCLTKRVTGCGAGFCYLAVAADGRLYPCHQFVGDEAFCLGDLNGVRSEHIVDAFLQAHVYNKPCRACWARFYCGGGCHAAAYAANGTIFEPSPVACGLMRRRLECALYVLAARKTD